MASRQGCIQTTKPGACLGELFRQKEACLLSEFRTAVVAKRPWLCTLLGPTKICYIFFKAPQRKMVWLRGQEDGDRGVGRVVSTVSFVWSLTVEGLPHCCPKPH